MAQQIINIGAAPDDGTGDPLRLSFDKTNENFTELYAKGATEGLWNYNKTSTDTSTTPVSGRFKTNSGNYRDATQIAIHAITIQGIDRTSTLRAMLVGDIVQCQDSTNSAAWCRFSLQSLPVDHGTWFQLNVTLQTDGGVTSGDNQEIVFDFTASSGAAAGGNVSNSGTPTLGQYGKWVTATTIQGVAPATVLSDIGAQPLDGDLTALAALSGTNTIYYRSAASTWSAVNVSTGLAFSGGNLTATGSGNVSNSGTPTGGQLAQWTDATHVQGIDPAVVGAGRVLLATINPSGTPAAIIGPSILTSAYDVYEVELFVFNNSGASVQLALRYSTDGGATYWQTAGNYYYATSYGVSNATGGNTGGTTQTFIGLSNAHDVGSTVPVAGIFKIFRPALNGVATPVQVNTNVFTTATGTSSWYGTGTLLASVLPINAMQILWSNGGNFGANSLIKVYGLR